MLLTEKTKKNNGTANSLDTTGKFQVLDNSLGSHDLNNYSLSKSKSRSKYVRGNLRANTFSLDSRYDKMIFSGNGNVDYGSGKRDTLNLSHISSKSVKSNYASIYGGGVLYNPGKGSRVFDAITLSNGKQILFEGIEKISFRDRTVNLSVKPSDPLFNKQWNLHMTGVHNAWRFTKGSSKVLVGVQDTGLGTNSRGLFHSDLRTTTTYKSNYRDDYFHNSTGNKHGSKTSSHGTPVQGIIAAASNNGRGISGINWNSKAFHIDVLGGNQNDQSKLKATQNMINEANRNGQRLVINMSFSGGRISSAFEKLVAQNQKNALFVMSSGNDNRSSLSDPASLSSKYSNVISVGASWGTRDRRGNSKIPGTRISYSGSWGSNYGTGLTLMAPSEVHTTNAKRNSSGIVKFGYDRYFNGTSAAAPHVTGIASLVWSVNSRLSATQIKSIMSQTAYDLGAKGYDKVYGHGLVNADAAVRRGMALARGAA